MLRLRASNQAPRPGSEDISTCQLQHPRSYQQCPSTNILTTDCCRTPHPGMESKPVEGPGRLAVTLCGDE
ncbi:hypothetical protein VTK56DRAFT_6074 [Thermocarpiscus australiensis]